MDPEPLKGEKEMVGKDQEPGGKEGPSTSRAEVSELKRAFAYNLFYRQGKPVETATLNDLYMAVAYTIRDRMQHLFMNSVESLMAKKFRIVCYLSAEFLLGPHLENNLVNLGLYEKVERALREREILRSLAFALSTIALTRSPSLRTSEGWFTRSQESSETWMSPSIPSSNSTNAPKSVILVTTPSTSAPLG